MKTLLLSIVLLSVAPFAVSAIGTTAPPPKTTEVSHWVKGRVTDSSGAPVSGVTVGIKGTTLGVVTDSQGFYSLPMPKGRTTLIFSLLGYDTQEVVAGTQTVIDIVLLSSTIMLDEAVVTGYFTRNTESLTGASVAVRPAGRRQRRQAKTMSVISDHIMIVDNNSAVKTSDLFADFQESMNYLHPGYAVADEANTEEYAHNKENRFLSVAKAPLSTFSLDVDAASYSNMRRMINEGKLPPADAIRTEELINYFSYDYARPTGADPVSLNTEVGACPWNSRHRLVRIGVKAREIESGKLPASNFVFLIDVSGSMYGARRLDLVKASLKLLVNNLRPTDKVSIVVYAGAAGVVLPTTSGDDKQKIRTAIDELEAGGSTAGGAGIERAYEIARENFVQGGNNRIILCTDGDFNVGISSPAELEGLIEQKRKSGVFLTVLGYGMGNYKDNRLQTLAEKGNGNHAYIDNMQEANRVLVSEFGGTMHAVAKDVKLQVEFNPAAVQAYRLIGYESRLLADEDFNDDTKDAGELGAGHTVTALYEVIPVGVKSKFAPSVDPLKYQKGEGAGADGSGATSSSRELLTVKLRYKQPDGDTSKLMSQPVMNIDRATILTDNGECNIFSADAPNGLATRNSNDFHFAAAVALFGQMLGGSDFVGSVLNDKDLFDVVVSLARSGLGNDPHGYRREFVRLVESAKGLK